MSCWYLLFWGLLLAVLKEATAEKTCAMGYSYEHDKCVDENECDGENPICGANATCYNTNGSYYCQCVTGYQTKSRTVNFTQESGGKCNDINECTNSKGICGSNAKCQNFPGSYYCMCVSGFVASNGQERFNASESVTCNDINECNGQSICGPDLDNKYNNECNGQNICGPDAECRNREGFYYCTCPPGFVASNGQERFNASQDVQCKDNRKHSEDNKLSESSGQQFNPTVPTLLPLILWILMFYQ